MKLSKKNRKSTYRTEMAALNKKVDDLGLYLRATLRAFEAYKSVEIAKSHGRVEQHVAQYRKDENLRNSHKLHAEKIEEVHKEFENSLTDPIKRAAFKEKYGASTSHQELVAAYSKIEAGEFPDPTPDPEHAIRASLRAELEAVSTEPIPVTTPTEIKEVTADDVAITTEILKKDQTL